MNGSDLTKNKNLKYIFHNIYRERFHVKNIPLLPRSTSPANFVNAALEAGNLTLKKTGNLWNVPISPDLIIYTTNEFYTIRYMQVYYFNAL